MRTARGLYQVVRQKFPAITKKADALHIKEWGELNEELAYSWFESLAKALNNEMNMEHPYESHKSLFEFLGAALPDAEEEVLQCIDVAFVENLFWQVPSRKCGAYWRNMPLALRKLYIDFHRREP